MIESIALGAMLHQTVKPGDTLSGIAATHGVSLAAMEDANPQLRNPNLIFPGNVVRVPRSGTRLTGKSAPAAVSAGTTYTVHKGDSLSKISKKLFGKKAKWPALWWANHRTVKNPNVITAGEQLAVPASPEVKAWQVHAALDAIPAPPVIHYAAPVEAAVPAAQPVAQPAQDVSSAGTAAPGSFQACVLSHESGGNYQAVNLSSGAGGAYQFLPSTWASLGYSGLPENAPAWEQDQAFQKEYAQSGTSAWAAYDGC